VKILHVVPTYLPARRYGGPIVAVHGLGRALAQLGHDVTVYTTNVDGDQVSDVPLDREVILDGVHVRYFGSTFRRLYFSPAMRKAFHEIGQFDVVHNHSVFLWPTAAAAGAAARKGVPYLISPRGMLVPGLIRRKSAFVKRSWLRLIERRNFAQAAGIHFTSQREHDDASATGIPIPRAFIVPNGIDLIPRPGVPRSGGQIVYLGRINWKKGLDRLIESMPRIDGARLIIAGNDEESLTPALQRLAERHGVGDRIEFRGPVYGDAKWNLLAEASLFVLPSLSENFGNVVLEAMMMSTPVIVTPGVGLADEVANADAGLVGDDLAEAINTLLADPQRAARMGRNGRALVESRFTWDAVAKRMEDVYRCSSASRP